jgi:formylglycine-generating enzyme required for sulfatase activity
MTITNLSTDTDAVVSSIELGGANAGLFTLEGHTGITTVAANGTATFTVQPNHGLAAGTYNTTINVHYDGVNSPAVILMSFVVNHVSIEMVWIEAGSFQMGQIGISNATPVHQVTLTSGFWMGIYPVTQEQWESVIGFNPSWFKTANGRPPATGEIDARRPVENVSWYDALVFCNRLSLLEGLSPAYSIGGSTDPDVWMTLNGGSIPTIANPTWDTVEIVSGSTGYRLPTEAQWEYACRAGTTTQWHFGDTGINIEDYAWYFDNSGSMTREVGLLLQNVWGLHEMHGNVSEWVWDWWETTYPNTTQIDPTGPATGAVRVVRGSNWESQANGTRTAIRGSRPQFTNGNFLGLRVVRP